MRNWLKMLLLAGMFTVLLCGSALAAGEKGIGDVSSGDKFTVQTANGTPVQTVPTNQLPDGMKSNFYPNAERIAINCKYTGMPAGEEVIVFVLTEKAHRPQIILSTSIRPRRQTPAQHLISIPRA